MKEKILQQLKLACGENTSISDRTLDTLASSLSAEITEETAIPAAIEKFKPILKEFDGNISAVAANAVKNQKPLAPILPIPPTIADEPAWFKAHREAQERLALELKAKQQETEAKLLGIEKGKQTETMVAEARTQFYNKYQVSEAEKALCEKSLKLHLTLNPTPESADKIIDGWKTQFEDLRSDLGLGGLTPVGSNGGGSGSGGNAALKSLKEQFQREGKIPPSQN